MTSRVSHHDLLSNVQNKVVLVGDVGVGKTTMFNRFLTGEFKETDGSIHQMGEHHKTWKINDVEVSLTLFDTAGMERHTCTIPHTYFRCAKVVALVYSVDDMESFDSLTSWADNACSARLNMGLSDPITVLIGNKVDLDQRIVPLQRAKQFATNNDIQSDMIFEISTKDGTNFDKVFNSIAMKLFPEACIIGDNTSESKKTCCS